MKSLRTFAFLLLVLSACKDKERFEPFSLNEVSLTNVYKDSLCIKKMANIQKVFFENELKKYQKKHSDKLFYEIMIAHFSHSGEVVDYNTLVVLSFKDEKVKVIWEGMKTKDSIFLDDFGFNNFKRKFDN